MFLSNPDQSLIVCFLVANERAICFDNNGVVSAVFNDFTLLTPGVELA